MNKRFILLSTLLLSLSSMMTWAGPVSHDKALTIASRFFSEHGKSAAKADEVANAKAIMGNKGTDPAYYVFNAEDAQGYVIVSGEDKLPQLIGYSLEESWPADDNLIPTPLRNALANYSDYVEALRAGKVEASETTDTPNGATVIVQPLLTTRWNQDYPYNKYAPEIPSFALPKRYNGHYQIGCTAVAVGQIVNYWGQKTGKPAHPSDRETYAVYENYFHENYDMTKDSVFYTLNSNTTYDYANIPDSIGYRVDTLNIASQEELDRESEAVGKLMGDIAYSLNMQWTFKDGGASEVVAAPDILCDNFGFSKDSYAIRTLGYGEQSKYIDLIKADLDKGYPVLVGGKDENAGGHSFVYDGYDSNNFVHVNWGWGGACNNWFDVAYLQTDRYDEHEANKYNFSTNQSLILNIHPLEDGVVETPKLDNNNIQFLVVKLQNHSIDSVMISAFTKVINGNVVPVAYYDKDNNNFDISYVGQAYHKSFGYDYDYRIDVKNMDSGETISGIVPDTEMKNYGLNRSTIVNRRQDINTSILPDGTYELSGAMREELNGETSEWKAVENADTFLIAGNHIVGNPEIYKEYYHGEECIHYCQDDNNRFLAHMEFTKDPMNLVYGDEMDMLFELYGCANGKLKINSQADLSVTLTLSVDGKEGSATLGDYTEEVMAFYQTLIESGAACFPICKYLHFTAVENYVGKTLHFTFSWPALGVSMTNDVKVSEGTGIREIKKTAAENADSRTYNLAGQNVSGNYHGIIIQNGRKYIK